MNQTPLPIVSVIVPVYNEIDNVDLMYHELLEALQSQARPFEIVLVDDGSIDGTTAKLEQVAEKDERVKLVVFRRNYGQTAAMHAGIQNATGDYLVTIDGDLQNDPNDIPMMLDKLDEGFDLVHGWRKDRKDKLLSRKIPSRIANRLISKVTEFPIHDLGCTLKAMRSEIAQQIELYGEMHRFIPILAHQLGAKSVEVVTNHRARQFGETKYGIGRTFRVVLDLITVKYMLKYFSSPMKLFGKLGLWIGGAGMLSCTTAVLMKVFSGVDMTGNPFLLMGILSAILSVQFFSLGLIGEVCARIYYTHEKRTNYQIRNLVNFQPADIISLPRKAA
ncbi:glycosyltransferase family 2 protein [Mariniblastus sp.]|jgi:glycosyltransferase involved in cell wall biosynthesis|nr:glycosyltransferase family 2 protein [Mariniblastus sp.]MDA7904272.1 glycosyltransferase family 2 protein [bacterium]